ncbi:MAG: fibrillarin-like rRNA/tRNA 2'-O-methyltransferase [Methanospirillum sp.]|nr:fibrillarin-like rRNA/tRNA 2'-O-methyltransferase [Methanospirillum sp.]
MIWRDGVLVSPGAGGVYGERMRGGFRVWDPRRSKVAALAYIDREFEIPEGARVLYLGAANGTTVSHVADYAEVVYAVEFAPRPMQDLLAVASRRTNIVPILADANRPGRYAHLLEPVDLIVQDVSQPHQAAIAVRNRPFLVPRGRLVLMLKARSIDQERPVDEIGAGVTAELGAGGYAVESIRSLVPHHRDHLVILARTAP